MSDRRNNLDVTTLLARVAACKLTLAKHIWRLGKTGDGPALAAIERHCQAIETKTDDRIAAEDYQRFVEVE